MTEDIPLPDKRLVGKVRYSKFEKEQRAGADRAQSDPGENNSAGLGAWDAGDDGDEVPPRGWLLGNLFCRKFVSSLFGTGGVGKTALRLAQLLSLATGRPLTGEHVFQRCRVLIVSLEDSPDELRRRILAAMRHHGITRAELKGWLYLASPGAAAGKLLEDRDGIQHGELAERIEAEIVARKIDIVSLDPFIKTHAVEENANSAIDEVVQILADLAAKHDIAIDVPHHTSKGVAAPGDADRGRGASAAKDAMRLVYTLAPMTEAEANIFGVSGEQRRLLVRMDSAKVNIAPPMALAKWFRLVSVSLGNGTDLYPGGDDVQTVEPWTPPDPWGGMSNFTANQILDDIDTGLPDGERYSSAPSAKVRAAWRVVARHVPALEEGPARAIITKWKKTGTLIEQNYKSVLRRKTLKGLKVDPARRPS